MDEHFVVTSLALQKGDSGAVNARQSGFRRKFDVNPEC
jgi:hypothetical protein